MQDKKSSLLEGYRPLLAFALLVVLVQAGIGVLMLKAIPSWEERGQLGDMFGVVNTLFSGLAFAGVIYAILLQRRELALQREELKLTRNELKRTAEAQEQSATLLQEQVVLLKKGEERSEKETWLAAQPVFEVHRAIGKAGRGEGVLYLRNSGEVASNLTIQSTTGIQVQIQNSAAERLVRRGGELAISFKHEPEDSGSHVIELAYADSMSQRGSISIEYDLESKIWIPGSPERSA